MNAMFPPREKDPNEEQTESEEMQPTVNPFPYELNIADGAEFIDDGMRMKDQPLDENANKDTK